MYANTSMLQYYILSHAIAREAIQSLNEQKPITFSVTCSCASCSPTMLGFLAAGYSPLHGSSDSSIPPHATTGMHPAGMI
jgi:hypothetical protein